MAHITFINPRFEVMEYWRPGVLGKRAVFWPNLPLLTALTPAEHQVTLIDESIEPRFRPDSPVRHFRFGGNDLRTDPATR